MVSKKRSDVSVRRRFIVDWINGDGGPLRVEDVARIHNSSDTAVRNDLRFLRSLGIQVGTKRGIIGAKKSKIVSLIRQLEFPAEYKESAVSILSYFSRVLEQKYPEIDAGVSIEQKGLSVTMKIEGPEGKIDAIEKTLGEYGEVVQGQLAPSEFFSNPSEVMELNNRLEIAKLELRLKQEAFLSHSASQERRIESLEAQLSDVRNIIRDQLSTVSSLASSIEGIVKSERVSPAVAKALSTVTKLVSAKHTEKNEKELRSALDSIRSEDAALFERLSDSLSSVGHSVAANLATPWAVAVLNALPK